MLRRIDRRTFLRYSIATSVIWTGWNVPREAGLSVAEAADLFQIRATGQTAAVFPQSVASGDPQPQGITLWTRIAPDVVRPTRAGEVPLPPINAVNYAIQASNPHIKYFNSQDHGYCIVEVTPERVVCTMTALAGGTQAIKIRNPQAPMTTIRTFEVRNGESRMRQL
jgi:phosphodiesterase/alkaline phosphatase D-like protein